MDFTADKAKAAAVVSTVLGVLTALSLLTLPDPYQGWVTGALLVLIPIATALGVYQVPNKPIPADPAAGGVPILPPQD